MRIFVGLALTAILTPVASHAAEDPGTSVEDNRLLSLVIERSIRWPVGDGSYEVVAPTTGFSEDLSDPKVVAQTKSYILDHLRIEGYDLGPLAERLLERNRKHVRLKLESAPDKGYVIDQDDKFREYFDQGGGGWEKWYKDNPRARCYARVSLPAFDKDRGMLLVYMETVAGGLSGGGGVSLFKMEGGRLKLLRSIGLWIA